MKIQTFTSQQPYEPIFKQMQAFTKNRNADTEDELWLLEHQPVFTQGLAGKAEHVLNPGDIPIVQTDRGGQVTYHGPGQLMVYFLGDLKRLGIGARTLVVQFENVVIELMKQFGVEATGKREMPGVYVNDKKLCSIGLRVSRSCCYHGIALNVCTDLDPFHRINPCGYKNLQMCNITDFAPDETVGSISEKVVPVFKQIFF